MSTTSKADRFKSLRRGVDAVQAPTEHKTEAIDQLIGQRRPQGANDGESEGLSSNNDMVHRVGTPQENATDQSPTPTQLPHVADESEAQKPNTNATYHDDNSTSNGNVASGGLSANEEDGGQGSVQDFNIASVMAEYEQSKMERLTYEERFTKRTFLVERDLIDRLDKIADKRPKGFKTRLINELLAAGLRQIEEQSK